MDTTVRKNQLCIIGLPRCDYVFSSARSCFIAYAFESSPLEADVLRQVLRNENIEPVDAGESFTPGQLAFCTKICSKIITSQFCAVLLNNSKVGDQEFANANVQMEYGMMLGFSKYVVPFQRQGDGMSFNISGLDTKKYKESDFKRVASEAVKQADEETRSKSIDQASMDQLLEAFLLSKGRLVVPLTSDGDRNFYDMGRPLGYMLLSDFSGMNYMYFGNFMHLNPAQICWRIMTLTEIVTQRRASLPKRVEMQLIELPPDQLAFVDAFMSRLKIWVLVSTQEDIESVQAQMESVPYAIEFSALEDMWAPIKEFSSSSP